MVSKVGFWELVLFAKDPWGEYIGAGDEVHLLSWGHLEVLSQVFGG